MANPLDVAELHAVFQTCGIANQATRRAQIIGREGFTSLASLGKLKSDSDITEIAKLRMAHRTIADGRVQLGIGTKES
jgi:hypothetical protein